MTVFAAKPAHCPERFTHCGQCNVYPCSIGEPAIIEGTPPTEDERNIIWALQAARVVRGLRGMPLTSKSIEASFDIVTEGSAR